MKLSGTCGPIRLVVLILPESSVVPSDPVGASSQGGDSLGPVLALVLQVLQPKDAIEPIMWF